MGKTPSFSGTVEMFALAKTICVSMTPHPFQSPSQNMDLIYLYFVSPITDFWGQIMIIFHLATLFIDGEI